MRLVAVTQAPGLGEKAGCGGGQTEVKTDLQTRTRYLQRRQQPLAFSSSQLGLTEGPRGNTTRLGRPV